MKVTNTHAVIKTCYRVTFGVFEPRPLLGSQLERFVCFFENWLDITAILNRLRTDAAPVLLAITGIRNKETAS